MRINGLSGGHGVSFSLSYGETSLADYSVISALSPRATAPSSRLPSLCLRERMEEASVRALDDDGGRMAFEHV
jgi:hypothetical protein